MIEVSVEIKPKIKERNGVVSVYFESESSSRKPEASLRVAIIWPYVLDAKRGQRIRRAEKAKNVSTCSTAKNVNNETTNG